ncbi:hypothetical protein DFH06DRAFT_1308279 [Mycena polygramma]|nr:hypothetical protein DFH06DRAFT_1308279 [Mycena polygramma]
MYAIGRIRTPSKWAFNSEFNQDLFYFDGQRDGPGWWKSGSEMWFRRKTPSEQEFAYIDGGGILVGSGHGHKGNTTAGSRSELNRSVYVGRHDGRLDGEVGKPRHAALNFDQSLTEVESILSSGASLLLDRNPNAPSSLLAMGCTKLYVKAYVIGFLGALFFLLTPVLIEAYYPEAAPVAAAFDWVNETAARGLGALSFVMGIGLILSVGNSACKGLVRLFTRRASPATGPISLEDGTADAGTEVAPATPTAIPAPAAADKAKPILLSQVLSLLSFTYFFTRQCMLNELVSLDRPVLDNVLAVALYVLRGLEVVFTLLFALLFIAWVRHKKPAAPAAEEPPVLPVVAEAPVEVKDKDEKELLVEAEAL